MKVKGVTRRVKAKIYLASGGSIEYKREGDAIAVWERMSRAAKASVASKQGRQWTPAAILTNYR